MRGSWLIFGFLAFMARPADAQVVRLCTTDWPPFTIGSGSVVDGVHTGVVVEAFRRLGLEAKVDSVAWERCWNELAKGYYHGVYSVSHTPQRALLAHYPKAPLQSLSYVAVIRRGEPHGWDGSDLGKLPQPLAAPRGYSITDNLRKAGGWVDDGAMKDAQNLDKLVAGRVGTAVIEAYVARALIRDMGLAGQVEVLGVPVGPPKDYYLVVGRQAGGSADLVARLEPVLANLAREGLVDRLIARSVAAAEPAQ